MKIIPEIVCEFGALCRHRFCHVQGGKVSSSIPLLDHSYVNIGTYMVVENYWTVQKWGQKFVFFLSLWIFGTFQFFQSLPLRWSKLSIAIFGPLSYLINWFFISLHQLWIPFVAKISCRFSQLIIKFAIWTPFTVHAVYCKDWTRLSQGQRFISWLEQFGQTK